MPKKMLIDAIHPEETRVALVKNGQLEDFDFEARNRKPLRGNIYLARVTRVEPSLQAAFVEYGGNRHGFLAFSEIHPDYYQIPVADRQALIEAEAEEAAAAEALARGADDRGAAPPDIGEEAAGPEDNDEEAPEGAPERADAESAPDATAQDGDSSESSADALPVRLMEAETEAEEPAADDQIASGAEDGGGASDRAALKAAGGSGALFESADGGENETDEGAAAAADLAEDAGPGAEDADEDAEPSEGEETAAAAEAEADEDADAEPLVEEIDDERRLDEARRKRNRILRRYKIQEVIKRRQILLVQVVKEERGNKGAALTTYLSLAGRYCVLMPNTARGGGVSRKITTASDRKRLRKIIDGLEVPKGMGLIIRTAGSKRTKTEIKRDYEYLLRLWENIRELTLKSIAPVLINEEASLIKRAIRDLYDKDIEEIWVAGEEAYKEAKAFMRMLMPSHAKHVKQYKSPEPLFVRHGVENQLEGMFQPQVRLKSGGYLVINQTEALVAVDVNSGKATRERNIESTALKTNLEAAEEFARQCRLRDLAGLIVIDFIDMEENRNNRAVEKKLKEALKTDRARIQIGRISGFGLLEMSRQRRRSGLVEGITRPCPACDGAGVIWSTESMGLRVLRAIEAAAVNGAGARIVANMPTDIALFVLNTKRARLAELEQQFDTTIEIAARAELSGDDYDVQRIALTDEERESSARDKERRKPADKAETAADDRDEVEKSEEDGRKRRKRRRGRREKPETAAEESVETAPSESSDQEADETSSGDDEDGKKRRRRRGRRGGRRSRRQGGEQTADAETENAQDMAARAQPDESLLRDVAGGPEAPETSAGEDRQSDPAPIDPAPVDPAPIDPAPIDAPIQDAPMDDATPETAGAVDPVEPVKAAAFSDSGETDTARRDAGNGKHSAPSDAMGGSEAADESSVSSVEFEPAAEAERDARADDEDRDETPSASPRRGWWQRAFR